MSRKNVIQVFGLQRSGTNLLEWSLINNFRNLNYRSLYATGNVPDDPMFGKKQSVKHLYPTMEYSQYAVVVFKSFDKWMESLRRLNWVGNFNRDTYATYLAKALALPHERTLLLQYGALVSMWDDCMKAIARQCKVTLNPTIIQPAFRLARNGGRRLTKFSANGAHTNTGKP